MILLFCPLHYTHNTTPQSQPRKHGRGTRGAAPASDAGRGCPRDGPRLRFFFFSRIRADSARFAPMRLDSCRIGFDLRRTGLIRPKSGCISHIGSYRLAADTAETGRKRPKQAEMAKIGLEYGWKSRNLPYLFIYFLNQGIVMCFLRIF